MKELAELIGIDTEFVARDLEFYRGTGMAYLSHVGQYVERDHWESVAFAATAFRRAGAHALLLDDAKLATEMFGNSAKCYEALRRPYGAMMWSLAQKFDVALASAEDSVREFIRSEGRSPSGQSGQLAFPLLVEGAIRTGDQAQEDSHPRRDSFRRIASELTAFSTAPLGILGIPIESYLSLTASMQEDGDPHETEYRLLPFLNAYEIAITTARSKRYHWRRLLMPFHPVEPDVLSVFAVANAWFRRHEIALSSLIRERSESRFASKLLLAALEEMEG